MAIPYANIVVQREPGQEGIVKKSMRNVMVTVEELEALRQAAQERDALRGELRVVTVERDLLKERVQAYLHKLYAARSEARSTGQKDLFFNEAEALAPIASTEPAREDDPGVEVACHRRKKRGGRKPRATSCVTSCPNPSAFARMTAACWSRLAPRSANSSTSFPSRYG